MALNVTTAVFAENCNTATASPSLAQWDTEQVLQISGIDLPDSYKVEFSTVYTRNAIPEIGDASGVTIPNVLLQRSAPITAYVVLYGENGGRNREYWITIYITPGQPPETITPDPEQADVIDEAIAALNNGVARTEDAAAAAEESARDAEAAAEAVQNLSVAAETLATGEPATVEKTVDPETGAVTLNFGLPRGAKGDPFRYEDFTEAQKAELVQGPIKAAQDAAVEAVNAAGTTQTGNVNQAGTTNVNAVNQAGTTQVNAVNQAGAAQVQAVEDKGNEVLNSIPQDYSDLVDDVADLSRHLSDLQPTATSADVGKAIIVKTVAGGKPTSYEYGEAGGGISGLVVETINLSTNVESVSLDYSSMTVSESESFQLQAIVLPATAIDKSVVWSSSNTSVATVDSSGFVTAISGGSAIITVTTNDGGFTANCTVTVTGKVFFSNINQTDGVLKPDGTISTSAISDICFVKLPYYDGMSIQTAVNAGWNQNTYPIAVLENGTTYTNISSSFTNTGEIIVTGQNIFTATLNNMIGEFVYVNAYKKSSVNDSIKYVNYFYQ